MARRWIGWGLAGAIVALVAFAPFRESGGPVDTQGRAPGAGDALDEDGDGLGAGDGGDASAGRPGGGGGPPGGGASGPGPGSTSGTAGAGPGERPATGPDGPALPTPTERELAVLGPLISAMDTGQRAGTPLLLGIATSVVASGFPADDDVPPELRPVLAALAELIATPGAQVNDLTAQNSVQLAQLDRALGELAFLNPSLNAAIHATADQLAAFGRAAEPVSPPGAVLLSDLAVLLTFFIV